MSDFYAITIGNFDGVHRGHRELLRKTVESAKKFQGRAKVYTFDPHPAQVLAPEKAPLRLFDLLDQKEQFEALGIDQIEVIRFTTEFAKTSPEDFFANYVLKPVGAKALWVGHDFHFGKARMGNQEMLFRMCERENIEFKVLEPIQFEGHTVSSTRIRNYLIQGQLEAAQKLLGRPYFVRGEVVHGAARGRTIGFPTANLSLPAEMRQMLPLRRGVYAGEVSLGSQHLGSAVLNIGINPTVSGDSVLKIEAHIFDFSKEIYGENIKIELKTFLRDEKKFSSLDELKLQIQRDATQARAIARGAR